MELLLLSLCRRGWVNLLNEAAEAALEVNWAVVSEGVQTILRREGYPKPYEALKTLTRTGEAITAETMSIGGNLDVSDSVKEELELLPFILHWLLFITSLIQ